MREGIPSDILGIVNETYERIINDKQKPHYVNWDGWLRGPEPMVEKLKIEQPDKQNGAYYRVKKLEPKCFFGLNGVLSDLYL